MNATLAPKVAETLNDLPAVLPANLAERAAFAKYLQTEDHTELRRRIVARRNAALDAAIAWLNMAEQYRSDLQVAWFCADRTKVFMTEHDRLQALLDRRGRG